MSSPINHRAHDHANTNAARAACREGRPQPVRRRPPTASELGIVIAPEATAAPKAATPYTSGDRVMAKLSDADWAEFTFLRFDADRNRYIVRSLRSGQAWPVMEYEIRPA